ncbi:hypothetical protein FQZ97_807160 [compost metagenome]
MRNYKNRPLTRSENILRLLFEHADEVIDRLEFLNLSANKLERLELLINGFEGTPGLLEVMEALTYEVNRFERRAGRSSNMDMAEICSRLVRIESVLDKVFEVESRRRIGQKNNLAIGRKVTIFLCLILILGVLSFCMLASDFMVV